jgi:hypothetical protein
MAHLLSRARASKNEPAPAEPLLDQLRVVVAGVLRDVRRADRHGARPLGVRELHLEHGADDPPRRRFAVPRPERREDVVGPMGLDLVGRAAQEEVRLAEPGPFHAGHVHAGQRRLAAAQQRLQRVLAVAGEEVLVAEEVLYKC